MKKKTAVIMVKPMGKQPTAQQLFEWKQDTESKLKDIECVYVINHNPDSPMIKVENTSDFDSDTILELTNHAMINISKTMN